LAAWSPGEPNLYALAITVTAGGSADAVRGYFGARSIETRTGEVLLNGERLYQKLVLNQGYYPRGHYTPVDPAMYRNDVELIKALGFNGMRVHQKIESPRLLFFADYLGLLVWEEMPSAQYFTDDTMANIEREWREVIARDINHPSIIAWAPMNESWGAGAWPIPLIFRADANAFVEHLYALTKSLDPTRLVVDNSGYDHTDATDIVDVHHYLKNTELAADLYTQLADLWSYEYAIARPLRWLFDPGGTVQNVFTRWSSYHGQPVMISEYGGFGFYDTEGEETLLEKFGAYTGQIQAQPHLVGYGYTQFADTYQEANGLVDADRKPKAAIADIRAINDARR
ncbi:glycoside hydrolase family 2, partial [bacterium]|nr:glycoside hydrolase family 2 [bacterium]